MESVKKSLAVCFGYLQIERKAFRTWFLLVTTLVMSHMSMEEVIHYSRQTEYRVTPWGYIFYTTTRFVRIVFLLLFLAFICRLPFRRENEQLFLLRSGRKAFCIGNIGYALINACLYTLLLAVSAVVWDLPQTEWSFAWGKIFGTLGTTGVGNAFGHSILISSNLILKEQPLPIFLYTLLLSIGCYFFLSLVMILCNLSGTRSSTGILVCGFFILLDYVLQAEPVFWNFMYVSPVSWSNITRLDIRRNTTVYPSLTYALAGYTLLNAALTYLIIKNSKKLQICKEGIG